MSQLEVLRDAAVLLGDNGRIVAVGPYEELRATERDGQIEEIDGVLFPGFVDAHTHGVFGAARTADHERRARGESYKAIAAAGGGILSTVRDVRARSLEDLSDVTRRRLLHLLALGTTTVEVKSGYGLSLEAELKQLQVIAGLANDGPALVPTFLGAHEFPLEFRERRDEYVRLVTEEMLPAVARDGLARFCDVFCEPGVYTPEQSRRVLEAAKRHGLGLKIHADELEGSGGAELAVSLGAMSADHLAAVSDEGIAALGAGGPVAVLLPGTMLFLGRRAQAPARRLVDAGAAVALATDFNPGSSPGMSLPLMAMLGVSQLGLLPAESIIAITANGAAAVGIAGDRGQIAEGFRADLTLVAASDWREVPYWYGSNLVKQVWVEGVACHPGRGSLPYLV
jgi:imidazolonepropionase